jgi:hypothetical protein
VKPLLSPNSSARQIGIFLFAIAFLAMGGVAFLIWGGLYVLLLHPPFSWGWILCVGLAFGLLMFLTRPSQAAVQEAQRIRRERVPIPGRHPILGDYVHWLCYNTWAASPTLPNGKVIELLGHGVTPSEVEVQMWSTIAANIVSLVNKANEAFLSCPDLPSPLPDVLLVPSRVELDLDGGFAIDFHCISSGDNIHAMFGARYSATLELLCADWEF